MKSKGILILTFFLSLIFMFCGTSTGPDDDIIDTSDSTAPSIPIGLAVDENASLEGTIKITWEANIDNDFDKYRVFRATGVDSLPLYILVGETRLTYHTDTGMEYNTDYYYRISAVDKNRNESEKSVALLGYSYNNDPPDIPSDLTVSASNIPGSHPQIKLHWTANTESDLSHYSIYRNTSLQLTTADSTYFIAQTTNNMYIDTDVEIGTQYYYRVTAVDKEPRSSNGSSVKSDIPLPQPSLIFPANGQTTKTRSPGYSWERVEGAIRYELIIQNSPISGELHRIEVDQPSDGTIVSKDTGTPTLDYGTEYFWLVAVFSSDNTAANTYSDSTWYFWTPSSK